MSRPTPARPVSLTVRRLVAAHDALGAVRALDCDLLGAEDDLILRRAEEVLADLRVELGRRAEVVVVVCDHLGPCPECRLVVRAGTECSTCLEEAGVALHEGCCPEEP